VRDTKSRRVIRTFAALALVALVDVTREIGALQGVRPLVPRGIQRLVLERRPIREEHP
jgi:hypothetical protein